jgi:DNA repair protein RecN (Recombination protein N)
MLRQLSVRNLVLIEALDLELGAGFNVVTGETGAGKSMVVDALGLVLGGRASPELVRAGSKEAEVEALFDVERGTRAEELLEAWGVPHEGEVVVRRVVAQEGRSRAYLNGRLVTAAQLAELGRELADIASQHESVRLTDAATHLEYLDAFGGLAEKRATLAERVDTLAAVVAERASVREAEKHRLEREEFLGFQLREIEELDPREGEDRELEAERARLRHADKLGHATRHAADRLYDGDEAICDALGRLAAELERAADLDPTLASHARTLDEARSQLVDAARTLSAYASSVEADPARLAEVEDRLFRLQKLLRRHGPTTAELLAHRHAIAAEIEGLAHAGERLEELEARERQVLAECTTLARQLSRSRREAAESLADAVARELHALGMGRARVVVAVGETAGPSDLPLVDGARLSRTGIDRVEFLIAPNAGEEPRALRKIASGGELSRALLAIKKVLAEEGPAGLYVFDEVDAGVGGAIAEVIGRSMASIAAHRQVFCITHLAPIAALGTRHYVVDKRENEGRTRSRLRLLTAEERVEEIARMMGGTVIGEGTRQAAREMLGAHASLSAPAKASKPEPAAKRAKPEPAAPSKAAKPAKAKR